jgi:hypothetical protein
MLYMPDAAESSYVSTVRLAQLGTRCERVLSHMPQYAKIVMVCQRWLVRVESLLSWCSWPMSSRLTISEPRRPVVMAFAQYTCALRDVPTSQTT